MPRCRGCLSRVACCGRARRRPVRLSEPPDPARRALWPRRRRRRRHAHHGGEAVDPAQAECRDREPARRRRHRRRQGGRDRRARRLQRADDRQQQRHRRGAVQVAALRHPQGLRLDLDGVVLRSADRRQGRLAAEESLQDVVKAAKANPGKLNIGTINPGSTQNLAAELFKNVTGIQVQIVPFRTSADMATALLRGDLDVMFEFFTAAHGLLVRQEDRRAGLDRAQAQRLPARGADRAWRPASRTTRC